MFRITYRQVLLIPILNFARLVWILMAAAVTVAPTCALSDEALVAVAANFAEVSKDLKRRFEADSINRSVENTESGSFRRTSSMSLLERIRIEWTHLILMRSDCGEGRSPPR